MITDYEKVKDDINITRRKPESSIIIFTSAKGGSGCSFLAGTIASFMAQNTVSNVLLLDLNTGRRDSRITFDINDVNTDYYLDFNRKLDIKELKGMVVNLKNSLNIIPAPLKKSEAIVFNNNLARLIEVLRDCFDIICIDSSNLLFSIASINI